MNKPPVNSDTLPRDMQRRRKYVTFALVWGQCGLESGLPGKVRRVKTQQTSELEWRIEIMRENS